MAVAIALGMAGADVCINYFVGDAEADAVVKKIQSFGVQCFAHKANVADEKAVIDMFSEIKNTFGMY
jgi:NAD(P)-dependent dehydrogenase (short-subunit alcohol dehydrogenase family)